MNSKRKCAFKDCGQRFRVESGIVRGVHAWCSEDHMIQWGIIAGRKLRKAKQRQEKAELRERVKTLAEWVTEAQGWVNKVVVLEDKPKGCISCDSPLVTECGHYFHRGSKYRIARLTLSRLNLAAQCGHCNRWKGGMQHEYRLGLIARYGQQAFDDLCELKRLTDCKQIPPLTVDDCKKAIEDSKAILKKRNT